MNYDFKTANELFSGKMPPMEWLVKGLIEEKSCIVMAGEPKRSIKTWILCEIIHAISSGRAVFGDYEVREAMRPTFLLAIEDSDASVRSRIESIAAGHHNGNRELRGLPLHVRGRPVSIDLADRGQAEALARRIVSYSESPALICIDTLSRANRANENSAQEMGVVWDSVTTIRDITQAAVIVTHHKKKPAQSGSGPIGNSMRGSTAIWGATEGLIDIEPIDFRSDSGGSMWTCKITPVAKTADAVAPFVVQLVTKNGPDRRAEVAKWSVVF